MSNAFNHFRSLISIGNKSPYRDMLICMVGKAGSPRDLRLRRRETRPHGELRTDFLSASEISAAAPKRGNSPSPCPSPPGEGMRMWPARLFGSVRSGSGNGYRGFPSLPQFSFPKKTCASRIVAPKERRCASCASNFRNLRRTLCNDYSGFRIRVHTGLLRRLFCDRDA